MDRVGFAVLFAAFVFALAALVVSLPASTASAQEQRVSSESSSAVASEQDNAEDSARDEARTPLRLIGASVEIVDSPRDPDTAPNRLLVEVPEGCLVAADEDLSLTVEDSDGTRAEVSGGVTRISTLNGDLSLANRNGGNLDMKVSGGKDDLEKEAKVVEAWSARLFVYPSAEDGLEKEAKVVEAEGFFCREAASGEAGERKVLAQTSEPQQEDETRAETPRSSAGQQYENSGPNAQQSAGQQIAPLAATAEITRDGDDDDGDIQSISITSDCDAASGRPEISGNASITLADMDDMEEQATFTARSDIEITASGNSVLITPTTGDTLAATGIEDLEGGMARVTDQTGISCGMISTAPEAAAQQLTCPSGQSLSDIVGFSSAETMREDMQTEPFTTTGSSFQIRYDITGAGIDPAQANFTAALLGANDTDTENTFSLTPVSTRDVTNRVVNLPAGTYRLQITAINVQYNITVSECRAVSSGNPGGNVIANTIPNKRLANTGGPSLAVIGAGVLFVGVGAAMILLLSRRGRGA